MMDNIKKFYFKEKYFKIFNKTELIETVKKDKDYYNFLNEYKKKYIESLSSKFKNINIIDYIKENNAWTFNNDSNAKLNYLFFYDDKPVGITKILTINIKNDFFIEIVKYLKCEYKDIAYIFNTFVSEKYRGKGINKLFIKFIVKNIKKKYLLVVINDDNISSIKSHLKVGFKKTNILGFKPNGYFYYKI
jgi:GNAT superfamily N-acetyltransferase